MSSATNKPKTNTLKNGEKSEGKKKTRKGWRLDALNNPRLRQVTGLFLLLTSVYLLFAFISYLMHWKLDDSLGSSFWSIVTDPGADARNAAGRLGHALSLWLIKKGFGVGSFLLVLMLFVSGIKLASGISLMPVWKTIRHASIGMVWISALLAYLFHNGGLEILGGATGHQMVAWMNGVLGKPGTGILLLFFLLAYLILSWSIPWDKLIPAKKPKSEDAIPVITNDDEQEEPLKINTLREDISEPVKAEDTIITDEEATDGFETVAPWPDTAPPIAKRVDEEPEIEFTIEKPAASATDANGDVPANSNREHYTLDTLYDPTLDLRSYIKPGLELLEEYGDGQKQGVNLEELESNKRRIIDTLKNYGITIDKIKATIGPTITLYEIVPAPGIRISKIKNLADDIALSLSAIGIRIIAPLPGKGTIGIEVPNQKPEVVSIKSILGSEKFTNARMELPIGLGKTISNEAFVADLTKMPHLLVAGATGQGKSVGLNAIITSLLYKKHPAELKFVMVDPKKVELTLYAAIERHFLAKLPDTEEAIITDTRKVVRTLNSLGLEMDMRYTLLNQAQVRNIKEYNQRFLARELDPREGHRFMPYIVVIVDEFADLIMTAGKEVEVPLTRLAQLARAIGIHLVIATQRPSTNIITGTIKANFPARVAFRVISMVDSRTILDANGANQLIGRGDMLLSTGSDLIRLQCAFVDTPEVGRVTEFIGSQRGYPDAHLLPEYLDENDEANKDLDPSDKDEMFAEAARVIVQHQHGSTSLLQRKLKLGYNRAGRIIDQLEAAGIVGPFEGSRAREVKFKDPVALEQYLKQLDEEQRLL